MPIAVLRTPHMTDRRGGDYAWLDRETLAAYVDSELVALIRRSGSHGRASIMVLIEPEDNAPEVYATLFDRAGDVKPSARYLRQRDAQNRKAA